MKTLTIEAIDSLEKRYRAQLINCITGIKSTNLIGTQSLEGIRNLAIFSSVIHLGSNPALVGFIQRPTSADRHTYENIVDTSYYTINAVNEEICMQAHQTSARYDRNEDEFEETSLEHEYLEGFAAPYVKNTPLKMGLQLEDVLPIPANGTKLVIGKVQHLHFDEKLLSDDGQLKLDESNIVGGVGLDTYINTKKFERYSYAKPDRTLKKL